VNGDPDADTLRLAIAAVRHAGRVRELAVQVRRDGPEVIRVFYEQLPHDLREAVEAEAHLLEAEAAGAMVLGHERYPSMLASLRQAPPALFYLGNSELLAMPSIGMCGSRHATDQGLGAARACGEEAARCGLAVISGYARGVDTEAHAGALDTGGCTILVLAEGIRRFKAKRWLASRTHDPRQVAVISQFAPRQPWSVDAAMRRNAVIVGLSLGLVVIEAGVSGGTLAAGMRGLDIGRPVFVLEFKNDMPPGNKILIDRGAVPIRSRDHLRQRFQQLLSGDHAGQLRLV
jgi:DNA processing protein